MDKEAKSVPALALRDLHFRWRGQREDTLAIPALDIHPGEQVFIHGPSGSGKSTLLSLVAGILVPRQGSVRVLGTALETLGARQRDRFRANHVGFVFQQFNLVPWLDVAANIRLAAHLAGKARPADDTLTGLLQALRLDPGLLSREAGRLSVGQQQRVAIARALVNAPELLVADEPTSALDAAARDGFVDLLLGVQAERGITVLFVSHDITLSSHFPRVLDMRQLNLCHREPALDVA